LAIPNRPKLTPGDDEKMPLNKRRADEKDELNKRAVIDQASWWTTKHTTLSKVSVLLAATIAYSVGL
jgi:hypothetical protein